jgi:hypothetical protein
MWLFPMPNMKPVYDRLFADNISSMKDAAKGYYNVNRLPKNVGDKETMTLQEMIDQKMVLPFIDSDGKVCDTKASYVEIMKMEDEYVLKISLSCPTKADYLIEHIGCNNVCDGGCDLALEYQFSRELYKGYKLVNGKATKYKFVQYIQKEDGREYDCGTLPKDPNNQTKCLVETTTKRTTPNTVKATEKKTSTTTSKRVCGAWNYQGIKEYSTKQSLHPSDTKYRDLIYQYTKPGCGDTCSSSIVYVYEEYTRTCKTVYDTDIKITYVCDTANGWKNDTKDKTMCVKACDTANGWKVDETNPKMCYKNDVTTTQTDAKEKIHYISVISNTTWSFSKTLAGWIGPVDSQVVSITNQKMYTDWVTKLPEGYTLADKKIEYAWDKNKTLDGWNPTGEIRKAPTF